MDGTVTFHTAELGSDPGTHMVLSPPGMIGEHRHMSKPWAQPGVAPQKIKQKGDGENLIILDENFQVHSVSKLLLEKHKKLRKNISDIISNFSNYIEV